MAIHHLVLAQDRGGTAKRVFSYFKPESLQWLSVVVKDLLKQEAWEYDQYHDTVENGRYALLFLDEAGRIVGKKELNISDDSPAEQYMIYTYSGYLDVFTVSMKTKEEFDEMVDAKRLLMPKGYRGY